METVTQGRGTFFENPINASYDTRGGLYIDLYIEQAPQIGLNASREDLCKKLINDYNTTYIDPPWTVKRRQTQQEQAKHRKSHRRGMEPFSKAL